MPGDSRRGSRRRVGPVAVDAQREVTRAAVPPLSLMTCLMTISVRGDVVVGDGAGLGLADGDRAGAVGRVARGVAGRAGLGDVVGARVEVTVVPGDSAPAKSSGVSLAPPRVEREVGRRRRAAVVVDDVLDHGQLRRQVVVGDRAGLGLRRWRSARSSQPSKLAV